MSILTIGTRPYGKTFISCTSEGKLTIDDCWLGIKEEFAWWEPPGNAWNGTFIHLTNGNFVIKNTEFMDVRVSGTNTFMLAELSELKEFNISKCTFTNCGCLGDGETIHIISSTSSSSSSSSTIFSENHFISCFNAKYGTVHVDSNIKINFMKCEFMNSTASEGGGAVYANEGKEIIFKECLFVKCVSTAGGAAFVGYLCKSIFFEVDIFFLFFIMCFFFFLFVIINFFFLLCILLLYSHIYIYAIVIIYYSIYFPLLYPSLYRVATLRPATHGLEKEL
jgi:hypothetical protein